MTFNKLYIALLILATTIFMLACNEYEDTYEPGPTVSADNPAVRFASSNATEIEVDPAAGLSFTLTVVRDNGTSALEVPVVATDTSGVFTIPETLSFAAGEDTVTITIAINSSAPIATALGYTIKFSDEYVNPYKAEYGVFTGEVSVLKWVKFATGTYQSAFFGQSWSQDLYNAEGTNKYRFYDLFADGYDFNFIWAGGKAITPITPTDANGYYLFETGYIHPSYGMVSFHLDSSTDWSYYSEDEDKFVFNAEWTVSAGSFDWQDDVYQITERF